ncbi:nitrilase [Plectosphaerella plurivora]|uniref:Nitrilase n=1 Tax=Plectosphaerella plurivora TaxID=936078 RepID=A0A9P9A9S9_9PEZI|nr:nitrilase [Plectosphaerella plurivora]
MAPPPHHIRLATTSPAPSPEGVPGSLNIIDDLARRAASQNIDILLLPEAFLGGYPRGSGFGAVVGSRTTEGREEFRRYFRGAVDLGDVVGPAGAGAGDAWVRKTLEVEQGTEYRGDGTREELERIAQSTGVFLVVGLVERAGGSLYCGVVYVDPTRGIIGKRRKVMPTGSERLIWAQGSPATLRAVSTTIRGIRINLAAAICWESYMPLLRQALYAQNINLYLAPTADARDGWESLMRTVGTEGRCFVVSSNMAVRNAPTAASSAAIHDSGDEEQHHADAAQNASLGRRRNSCLTQEGNEIALPSGSPSPSTSRAPGSKRRKSVIVEDEHEIVLGCEDDAVTNGPTNGAPKNGRAAINGTMSSQVQTAEGWLCRGGSMIASPFGDVLAGPQWEDADGIIYADVDFEDCVRGRLDLDAGGSYSRNDSFKFSVDGLDLEPLPY